MSKTSVLNTLNFRPSREEGEWSVIFFFQGRYCERRFTSEVDADKFAKYWQDFYSQPQWKHRPVEEWVIVQHQPLFLRQLPNGDLVEYK